MRRIAVLSEPDAKVIRPTPLSAEARKALARLFLGAIADPATVAVLAQRGLVDLQQDSPAFAALIKADRKRWAKVVKQGNIKAG